VTDGAGDREAAFQAAQAAVLGWRLEIVAGASVVLVERDERFALRFTTERPDMPLGTTAAQVLRLLDGERTVADIIDSIAGDLSVADAVVAGKAAMSTVHELYREGFILPARGPEQSQAR